MEKLKSAQASLKEGDKPLYTKSDFIRVVVILLYTILFVLSSYYAYKSYKNALYNHKKERYYITAVRLRIEQDQLVQRGGC